MLSAKNCCKNGEGGFLSINKYAIHSCILVSEIEIQIKA